MVGLDFVIDNDVKGKIGNISFTDVSVASVLKIILTSHKPKLALIKDLGVWRIMLLKDANLMFKSRAQALYEKLFVCGSKTIANAKWSETLKLCIEKMWDSIVGIRKGSKNMYLVFDDNTRSIFFRGEKKTIREFRHFLNEIDQRVPCVRIDARVVIAAKDFEESFGLQVSGVYNRSASVSKHWNFIGFGPVTTGGQGDIKPENLMDWTLNFLPSTAKQFLNAPFIFGGNNLNTRRLNLVLNAAEQRSEIETILKPSLLVNSGEIAEILVGQEVPIETSIQERIEGSLRDVNTISYKSLGMKLKVKPLVYPDQKTVFLDIFVENSYIKNGNAVTSFDAKTSIIVSNKSKNRVFLKSGQTTLIGGLISNEKRKEKQGIPILQNIPVLGFLFRGSRRVKSDDQLMIFITPTVV
jgi:type IV pilus assembly protein PilQ